MKYLTSIYNIIYLIGLAILSYGISIDAHSAGLFMFGFGISVMAVVIAVIDNQENTRSKIIYNLKQEIYDLTDQLAEPPTED